MYFNLTTNTQTGTFDITGTRVHVIISGTWGSGTAKLQFLDDNAAWVDFPSASWTSDSQAVYELGDSDYTFRIDLSGATGADLDITVK